MLYSAKVDGVGEEDRIGTCISASNQGGGGWAEKGHERVEEGGDDIIAVCACFGLCSAATLSWSSLNS